jgi:hypothetical protein
MYNQTVMQVLFNEKQLTRLNYLKPFTYLMKLSIPILSMQEHITSWIVFIIISLRTIRLIDNVN